MRPPLSWPKPAHRHHYSEGEKRHLAIDWTHCQPSKNLRRDQPPRLRRNHLPVHPLNEPKNKSRQHPPWPERYPNRQSPPMPWNRQTSWKNENQSKGQIRLQIPKGQDRYHRQGHQESSPREQNLGNPPLQGKHHCLPRISRNVRQKRWLLETTP